MNTCPPELHSYILCLACTDDGYTARSLSLVSRYFSQISLPYLYQSVSVASPSQIRVLWRKLQTIPSHLRKIRHLFISDNGCGEREIINLVNSILTFAAPTVETLAMVTQSPLTSTSLIARLFRTHFPHLIELTIFGYYPFPSSSSSSSLSTSYFPSLERLHLLGNKNPHGLLCLGGLESAMPTLTHLRVSGIKLAVSFSKELEQAFASSSSTKDNNEGCMFAVKLPPKLQQLLVQCGPPPTSPASTRLKDEVMVNSLKNVEERFGGVYHPKRLVVLPRSLRETSSDDIQKFWMDRLRGKEGCWSCIERGQW